jgi:hypothetical protein
LPLFLKIIEEVEHQVRIHVGQAGPTGRLVESLLCKPQEQA